MAISMPQPETEVKSIAEMKPLDLVCAVLVMRDEQAEARARTAPLHEIPDAQSWRGIEDQLRQVSGLRSQDAGQHADDRLHDIAYMLDGWNALAVALVKHNSLADDLLAEIDLMRRRERGGHLESTHRHRQAALKLAEEILAVERRREGGS